MKKELKFEVKEVEELKEKTIEYFENSGFKLIVQDAHHVKFSRGSIALNMRTFNPLEWKSEIIVRFIQNNITVNVNVNTIGQIVTSQEEKLWLDFINTYRLYLTENIDYKSVNEGALRKTKNSSFKYVKWMALGGLIGGILAGFFAYFTGMDELVGIGAVMGAMYMLRTKMNDEKRKTTSNV